VNVFIGEANGIERASKLLQWVTSQECPISYSQWMPKLIPVSWYKNCDGNSGHGAQSRPIKVAPRECGKEERDCDEI